MRLRRSVTSMQACASLVGNVSSRVGLVRAPRHAGSGNTDVYTGAKHRLLVCVTTSCSLIQRQLACSPTAVSSAVGDMCEPITSSITFSVTKPEAVPFSISARIYDARPSSPYPFLPGAHSVTPDQYLSDTRAFGRHPRASPACFEDSGTRATVLVYWA